MAGTRAKFPSRQGSAKVREPRNPMGPMSANKKRGGEPLVGHLWDGFCHILSNLVRVESEKNLTKKSADLLFQMVPCAEAYQNWVL